MAKPEPAPELPETAADRLVNFVVEQAPVPERILLGVFATSVGLDALAANLPENLAAHARAGAGLLRFGATVVTFGVFAAAAQRPLIDYLYKKFDTKDEP